MVVNLCNLLKFDYNFLSLFLFTFFFFPFNFKFVSLVHYSRYWIASVGSKKYGINAPKLLDFFYLTSMRIHPRSRSVVLTDRPGPDFRFVHSNHFSHPASLPLGLSERTSHIHNYSYRFKTNQKESKDISFFSRQFTNKSPRVLVFSVKILINCEV